MCQDDQDYIISLEEDAINADEERATIRTAALEVIEAVEDLDKYAEQISFATFQITLGTLNNIKGASAALKSAIQQGGK